MSKGIGAFMNDYVSDPRLRAALSVHSTCANLPPSKMSALGIAGLLIEGGLSIPHIKGGAQAVPDAFAKSIRAKGGEIFTEKLVEKILVKNKKTCGVRMGPSDCTSFGRDRPKTKFPIELQARYVISNASARQTFFKLIGEEHIGKSCLDRLGRLELTPPFWALLLGIDMDLKKMGFLPALHIHASTYDTEQYCKNMKSNLLDEHAPDSFFRFQPANLSDSTSATEGKTALVIHAIPTPIESWEDPDFKKRIADVMMRRAEKKYPVFPNTSSTRSSGLRTP
jgi:phytoene dehydrogenase-like protein